MKIKEYIENNNGIIPIIIKRIYCCLFRGHTYKKCTPEDMRGFAGYECTYCKKFIVQ